MRKQTGLQAIERYRLMKWVDEHRDECLASSDQQTADKLAAYLDIPHLTHSHVEKARRALGVLKPNVVPNPPAPIWDGESMQDVLTRLDDIEETVRRLADQHGMMFQ